MNTLSGWNCKLSEFIQVWHFQIWDNSRSIGVYIYIRVRGAKSDFWVTCMLLCWSNAGYLSPWCKWPKQWPIPAGSCGCPDKKGRWTWPITGNKHTRKQSKMPDKPCIFFHNHSCGEVECVDFTEVSFSSEFSIHFQPVDPTRRSLALRGSSRAFSRFAAFAGPTLRTALGRDERMIQATTLHPNHPIGNPKRNSPAFICLIVVSMYLDYWLLIYLHILSQ